MSGKNKKDNEAVDRITFCTKNLKLRTLLKKVAKRDGRSMSSHIERTLTESLAVA